MSGKSRGRAFHQPQKGLRNDGIRSVEDIRQRCRIDDITGCWVWAYGGDGQNAPGLWFPPLQKRTTIGVALCYLLTGKAPHRGQVWHSTCGDTMCCNPEHRKAGTRKSQMLDAKIVRPPLERARIAAAKRANSRLTDADCDEIRASTAPLRGFAERFGISVSYASDIRRGQARRPLAAPGSSVFTMGVL